MNRFTPFALLLAGALVVGVGCHMDDKDSMDHNKKTDTMSSKNMGKSLWDRLGGEPAVTAVVDDFVGRAASDPKVNFTRKGHPAEWNASPANVAKLKKGLVTFISENTGGPLKYKGKDMVAVHTGMEISDAEFNALAADLGASLDKFKVPAKEKNELIAVVASTRGSIVNK